MIMFLVMDQFLDFNLNLNLSPIQGVNKPLATETNGDHVVFYLHET